MWNDPNHRVYQILCGRRVLLKDGFDLHIAVRHGEFVVGDYEACRSFDLPLLEMVVFAGRGSQGDLCTGRSGGRSCGAGAVAVIGDGDGMLDCGGVRYGNRQLLLIVAHAVESLNGKLGGSFRSGRAADLAGSFVQIQTLGQLAVCNAPFDGLCTVCKKSLAIRRADRAVGQSIGDDGRRGSRTDELHPDRSCYRRVGLLVEAFFVCTKHQRAGEGLPIRGLRVIG